MRSVIFFGVTSLLTFLAVNPAEAGFFGSAYLRVFDARVEVLDGGVWRKAVAGPLGSGAANVDVFLLGASSSAFATATLNGSTDQNFASGADAMRAFVGTGAAPGDNSGFPAPLGTTPLGTPIPGVSPYTYSDTASRVPTGQLVNFYAPPPPVGGSVVVTPDSDVEVIVSSLLDEIDQFSEADSSVGTTSELRFETAAGGSFRLVFNYDVDLQMSLSTPPGVGTGFVSATFETTGNAPGDSISDDRTFTLNFGGAPFSVTGGSFTTDELNVGQNGQGSFTLARSVSLSMATVPEPSSIAVFGLIAVGGVLAQCRRRQKRVVLDR